MNRLKILVGSKLGILWPATLSKRKPQASAGKIDSSWKHQRVNEGWIWESSAQLWLAQHLLHNNQQHQHIYMKGHINWLALIVSVGYQIRSHIVCSGSTPDTGFVQAEIFATCICIHLPVQVSRALGISAGLGKDQAGIWFLMPNLKF